MPQNVTVWLGLLLVLLLAIGAAVVLILGQPSVGRSGSVEEGLPDEISGWAAAETVTHYDTETIYDYIDGHAEVYLAYGMRRSLARRYTGPEGEGDIVLDLFELASSDDAFGVFTHDLDGVPVGVGNDSRLRYGWLSFWQGPWFVSVSAEMESDRASQAVLELGRAIAAALPPGGDTPAIVDALPAGGLGANSVRFLRHPNILNTHYWLGGDDIFGLTPETAAALGTYEREGETARLLMVDYAGERQAALALESFNNHFLAGSGGDAVDAVGDRGWFGAKSSESRVIAVLGADSRELAEALLAEAMGGTS